MAYMFLMKGTIMTLTIYLVCGLLALLCAAVAVYLGKRASELWKTQAQFKQKGIVVKGTVDRRERKELPATNGRTISQYFVSYHYDYQGQTHTGTAPVTEKHYNDWFEGSHIDVIVLPGRPTMSRLAGDFSATGFLLGLEIGSATLGLGAIALIIIAIVFTR